MEHSLIHTHYRISLEEKKNCGCGQDPCITYGKIKEESEILDEGICEVSDYFNLSSLIKD